MKKHRQHHVWKAYLRGWATDERVWILQGGSHLHRAHLDDAAVQRHFYKQHPLTPAEIEYIRKVWIKPSPQSSHRVHENYLMMFSVWASMRNGLPETVVQENPEYVEFLEERIINTEEDYHAGLESGIMPLVDAIRRSDVSFYANDEQAMRFIYFLSVQHFRTSGIKQRVIERFKAHLDIDMSRCWNVISHILATNVGAGLYLERKRRPLVLLENKTTAPFITSDQPTVNLLGGTDINKGPEYLAFYYPVSPTLAVLLDDPDSPCEIGAEPLTEEQVMQLNVAEMRASNRQVFGNASHVLESLRPDPAPTSLPQA